MPLAFRHRSDTAPRLSAIPGFAVHREYRASVMADLQRRTVSEINSRFTAGHRAYVATVNGVAAAWGWVATSSAIIGELGISFSVSSTQRYLWNFVTLPEFRGQGIYPRLIDAIVDAESVDGERFWIAYAPENHASGAGIRKAGFTIVAELSFDRDGAPAVRNVHEAAAGSAAALLGVRDIQDAVAQCWKCAKSARPSPSACATETCQCDYQRPEQPCAA